MVPELNKKSTSNVFVRDVTPEPEQDNKQTTPPPYDSPKSCLTPSLSEKDLFPDPLPQQPCRAAARPMSLGMLNVNPPDVDVEKGIPLSAQTTLTGSRSPLYAPCTQYKIGGTHECTMWPSRQALEEKAKQDKTRRRGNACFGLSAKWGNLTRKQRLITRLLLVLLVVAIAVGVAVGISRAVGGTVSTGNGNNQVAIGN